MRTGWTGLDVCPEPSHGLGGLGREAATSYEAATDLLVDKLERQIERLRDKKVQEPRRRAHGAPPEPMPVEEIEQSLRTAPDG